LKISGELVSIDSRELCSFLKSKTRNSTPSGVSLLGPVLKTRCVNKELGNKKSQEQERKSRIMKLDTLQKLYTNELRDLYNAEHQLLKALPKMARLLHPKI